jgi:hypothetical protein
MERYIVYFRRTARVIPDRVAQFVDGCGIFGGERYHDPLRRIHRKVRPEFPTTTEHLALSLSNKAMNDTVGPEGLVPTLLVFGIIPRSSASGSLPNQHDRMLAMDSARRDMDTIVF